MDVIVDDEYIVCPETGDEEDDDEDEPADVSGEEYDSEPEPSSKHKRTANSNTPSSKTVKGKFSLMGVSTTKTPPQSWKNRT
ncbi:Uu.00g112200.m01.CDS01 [Anthostomella pinea]|uniref:Uu.00g112200.m01.CDS01 n=1 Tax=Anthostomella pinea TaxID=933095 RepID=A0AAI8YGK3_9PEZI|nr:Uu.00g112200.m01.CDS01 [Anthostomella pinea]